MRRFRDGHWERLSGKNGFPAASNASCLAVDAKGRVWVGHADGLLMRIDAGDRITRFTDKDGLRVGGVLALTVRDDHLWIGGDHGVQRFDDDAGLRTVRGVEPKALNGVSGIVETPQGELWLNGAAGITRVEAAEPQRRGRIAAEVAQRHVVRGEAFVARAIRRRHMLAPWRRKRSRSKNSRRACRAGRASSASISARRRSASRSPTSKIRISRFPPWRWSSDLRGRSWMR